MAKSIEKITAGGEISRRGVATAEVMAAYLAELDASPKTRDTYRKALRQYVAWLDGEGVELDQTTKAHVMAYKRHLQDTRSANTCYSYLVAVRSLYVWLNGRTGYPNVAEGIKAKRPRQTSKGALSISQARDLITAPAEGEQGLRDYAMVTLMLRRGLRTIEVSRANVEDMRAEYGVMVLYVQGKKRTAKDDFIVLGDECERAIRAYLKERGSVRPGEPLFAATGNRNRGGRMTTRSISRIAKQAMREQGIDAPHLTAHSLRHTAVTLALVGGATVQEVQAMARHANIDTTLIYAHNLDRAKAVAEHRIDAVLAGQTCVA